MLTQENYHRMQFYFYIWDVSAKEIKPPWCNQEVYVFFLLSLVEIS